MEPIRLYIVDDQILAINYFRSLVEASGGRYALVGQAMGAARALEEIPALGPDIVFVDVSMPGMDGLALSAELLRGQRELGVILLTSYRDFTYAQRGLQIGVASYIVKNDLTPALLETEIDRVMEAITLERRKAGAYRRQNLAAFLKSGEGAGQGVEHYHKGAWYLLALVRLRQPLRFGGDGAAPAFSCEGLEGARHGTLWRCRSAAQTAQDAWPLVLETTENPGLRRLQEEAAGFARRIPEALAEPVTVFLSPPEADFYRLPGLFAALERAGEAAAHAASELVLPADAFPREAAGDLHRLTARLEAAIHEGDREGAGTAASALLAAAVETETVSGFKRVFREALGLLDRGLPGGCPPVEGLEFPTPQAAADWLCGQTGHPVYSGKVEAAIGVIRRRYREDIGLGDVAGAVELSAGHLSRIFKAETGTSVPGYLRAYRIGQAKQRIREGAGSLGQIGEEVGFASGQYFSLVFKRMEGITPKDYQRLCHGGDAGAR